VAEGSRERQGWLGGLKPPWDHYRLESRDND
jgi:hypothetical protein